MPSGAKEPKNGGIAYVTKAYAFPAPLVKLGALVGLRNSKASRGGGPFLGTTLDWPP